jgi:hypothetical protein
MTTPLYELITNYRESLVDEIAKDAIRQIPSYAEAPLRLTLERTERWLQVLADSIAQNMPTTLAQYLTTIGEERQEEGYPVGDLHAIIGITERHIRDLIDRSYADPVEQDAQTALLNAVIDSARMVLSVTYVLSTAARQSQQGE